MIFAGNSLASDLFDAREVCENEKGVWREFGSDCADNCSLDRGYKKMCISKINYSCDCLENKCWDYYQCVDNDKYQEAAKKVEAERIKKIKESNPELFVKRQFVARNRNEGEESSQTATTTKEDGTQVNVMESEGTIEDQIASCASGNGIWKKFPNGCADSCISKMGPAVCTSVITESCDCGENRCWNGSACYITTEFQ